MFVLGHAGIGSQLISRKYPYWIVIAGAIFPDLLDKPIFYIRYFMHGENLTALGLISGTRTFGHICWIWILLYFIFHHYKNIKVQAFCLGAITHVGLDLLAAALFGHDFLLQFSGMMFPFLGFQFPPYPFLGMKDHLNSVRSVHIWVGEVIGAILLYRGYRLGRWGKKPFFWTGMGL